MDYSLEENEVRMLAAIDAALKRIDDGTYGRILAKYGIDADAIIRQVKALA